MDREDLLVFPVVVAPLTTQVLDPTDHVLHHSGVDLHVDGVQVLVGSPDVHVLDDGTDADALTRNVIKQKN